MTSVSTLKRKRSVDVDAPPQHQHHQLQPQHQHPQHHAQQHHHQQQLQYQQQQHQQHAGPPQAKAAKGPNHLQINYLARQNDTDLPLASTKDSMPEVVDLLNQYHGVLERHESLACNLGARPLGPILIKRFERLFEGPPRVLKSHGKDGAGTVTWLDVVEFARHKSEQFTLGQMSEGRKVCQFYTKQCRVQISEEDYVLISSGIPQKMIPPQPIVEDEEKELGTLEILEERLDKICKLADQVAARARQLNHRIRGRKTAILDRRATEPSFRALSPSNAALANGSAQSPNPGFVAVNSRPADSNGGAEYSKSGASAATRKELMGRFTSLDDRRASVALPPEALQHRASVSGPLAAAALGGHQPPEQELAALLMASNNATSHQQQHYSGPASLSGPPSPRTVQGNVPGYFQHQPTGSPGHQPIPIGSAVAPPHMQPQVLQRQPSHAHLHDTEAHHQHGLEKEKLDDGPFKNEMVARMESLGKGERVIPPCDRCRRLHMDCLKNLTACMGCTKKHAKCSWREVREDEVLRSASVSVMRPQSQQLSAAGEPASYSAVHSPIFDSAYQATAAAADAHTGYASTHAYDQAPSTGTRDDSGSEQADRPPRASNTIAEAEAAYSAAQHARSGLSTHGTSATAAHDSTQQQPEAEPPARSAYLEQLTKYTPRYGRVGGGSGPAAQDSPSPQPNRGQEVTTSTGVKHDETVRSGLGMAPERKNGDAARDEGVDVHMSGMDTGHVEMIRQRLLRAQQDSPDHVAGGSNVLSMSSAVKQHQEEQHHPSAAEQQQPPQKVTGPNAQHNRIWADDRPGPDSAASAAAAAIPDPAGIVHTAHPSATEHNSDANDEPRNGGTTNTGGGDGAGGTGGASEDVQPAAQPRRDPPERVQLQPQPDPDPQPEAQQ